MLNGQFNVEWNNVVDNRDLALLSSNNHQLHEHIFNTLKAKTNTDEILWLRYRFVLMQSLSLSNHILENQLNDSPQENSEHVNNASDTSKTNSDKLSIDSFAQLVVQLGELSTVAKSAIKTSVKVRIAIFTLIFKTYVLIIYYSTV